MNATKAKAIRRAVYGDASLKAGVHVSGPQTARSSTTRQDFEPSTSEPSVSGGRQHDWGSI